MSSFNCLVTKGFFTPEFCEVLIKRFPPEDFLPTMVRQKDESYVQNNLYRKGTQIVFDDQEVFEKIRSSIVQLFGRIVTADKFPELRIYQYGPGDFFKKHKDSPRQGYVTNATLLVSLSDDFMGGRTFFWSDHPTGVPTVTYIPTVGAAVLFDHKTWHEGERVSKGVKYVLRADVGCVF